MTCAEAREKFAKINREKGELFSGSITAAHKKLIKVKRGYCSEVFNGDKLIEERKSPDYIIFLWSSEREKSYHLRVVEVHKLEREVIEKKKSFEMFWEKTFDAKVKEVCQDYVFILIKTKASRSYHRLKAQFTFHNIRVMEHCVLP